MSNRACGKPKKSWIVRGAAIAVTAEALMNQCADTHRIARGRGIEAAHAAQAAV